MKEIGGKQINLRPAMEYCGSISEFEEKNNERVRYALKIAEEIHRGDMRKVSGEPYINHCVAVASILASWGADEDECIAGLLHDTVEDHPDLIDLNFIAENFGERVAFLVDGVTKLKTKAGEKSEFETLRKVTRESLIDVGVAKLKLADRKHNMTTMEGMKSETQRRKAKETLTVYAPLAESFGMWQVKNELEDLSFRYFDPARYEEIKKRVDRDPRLNLDFLLRLEIEIEDALANFGLEIKIEHQVGGYWEISEKQKRRGIRGGSLSKSISEIPDVLSFRVLVPEEKLVDCYKAMGVIRMLFAKNLIVGRHIDLLRESAVNGYSALNDTYVFDEGSVEICFTSLERERFNNWGITVYSAEETVANRELFTRKLVFTPKEELVFLDLSATGIDVAYKLSPLLGMRAVAIKIDGKLCGLNEVVPNASMVEILTDSSKVSPDLGWKEFASLETRRIMERQVMVSERDLIVETGRQILVDEVMRERGVLELTDLDESVVNKLLADFGCWYGVNDLYYKVATGMSLDTIRKKLDTLGMAVGVFTTLQITGENAPGVAKEVASVLAKNKADTRNAVERVFENDRYLIRILMKVGYKGKKRIEEELMKKYSECVLV